MKKIILFTSGMLLILTFILNTQLVGSKHHQGEVIEEREIEGTLIIEEHDGTTFKSCDVKMVTSKIEGIPYEILLQKKFGSCESYGKFNENKNFFTGSQEINPFIKAVHIAFAGHRPLVISPDMIWLIIVQGLSKHINDNSEKLRDKIVNFDGKKEIVIRRDEFVKGRPNPWDGVVSEFNAKIETQVGSKLTNLINKTFSTTGQTQEACFHIALMDAMSCYFNYTVTTICGIPQITLRGTTSDWEKILNSLDGLDYYELTYWKEKLKPIIQQFVNASRGDIDRDFWESIYKYRSVSGGDRITGWILKLFLNSDYVKRDPNPENFMSGARIEQFGSGLSKVDFTWKYYYQEYKMEFIGGFIGVSQDSFGRVIPEMNWVVRDKPSSEE